MVFHRFLSGDARKIRINVNGHPVAAWELGEDTSFLLVYYGTDGCGGWQRLDRPLRTVTTIDRFALVEPSATGHNKKGCHRL